MSVKIMVQKLIALYVLFDTLYNKSDFFPVLSAFKEPAAGYVDNKNGPVLLLLGTGLGVLHAAYFKELPNDLIPSDYTINVLIAIMSVFRNRWYDKF